MLHMCENELRYIDMSINYKKSCSMRIGPRCNAKFANIVSLSGQCLSRGLLNCGVSVSFSPVPEYLHAQLVQRSVLSIALLMLYLAKWEQLRPKKQFWSLSRPNALQR